MEAYQQFLIVIGSIVGAIIALKIFFTLWRLLEKKLHPDKFEKLYSAPEVVFADLKKKVVTVTLKNGDILIDHKYKKSVYFGDGEFGLPKPVYFELESPEKNLIFVSGADIIKIERK